MSNYQPNIPTGTVNLDEDYINLRNNFQELNTIFGKDHYPFNDQTSANGYHKAVHMVQQVAPGAISNTGALYCTTVNDKIDNDEILYYKTGLNKVIQLTMNFEPLAADVGRTFLPGGLILQWGFDNFKKQVLEPVTFVELGGISFPNNCFNVQATMKEGSSTNANVLNISALTNTGFSYYNTSASIRAFFWLAIGN